MKKYYLLLILFLSGFIAVFSQTTLTSGDIVITGFNSDNPDEVTFVLLTDILANTELKFTDSGWVSTGEFRGNEGIATWTATSDLPCGTEINFIATPPVSASFGVITRSGSFALAATGDQILAYQGLEDSPTFIYAVNFSAAGWSEATAANSSALPVGLTDGINALDLGNIDNAVYDCSTTTETSAILNAVSSATNWNLSNARLNIIDGCTYSCVACATEVTWDGTNWNWSDGTPQNTLPTLNEAVVLNANFNTGTNGNINACNLSVSDGTTLIVTDNSFINVTNEIITEGTIIVDPQGSVVQISDTSVNSTTGTIILQKQTSVLNTALEYTYWSSPVTGETIEDTFATVPTSRRFSFNAANFVDLQDEIDNTGTFIPGQDGIDDDGNAWQAASGTMEPGVGYATTASPSGLFPGQQVFTFEGDFNNGIIQSTLSNASGGVYQDWNFIGNPYPSAIDTQVFFSANTGVVDNIYLWSQATALDANASGNDSENFSSADYAIISASGVNTAGASGIIPTNYVASGQGFFVEALSGTNVVFNNAMRVTGDNNQFFRNTDTTQRNYREILWVNLTSDNGVFNQIAVAYMDGATENNDGTYYDVKRNASSRTLAKLYSKVTNDENEFVIQCKSPLDINADEIINLGFKNDINSPTIFSISLAQLEGAFLNSNNIYLKDNLLNTIHDLKVSDYNFTSDSGEFSNRFNIVFNTEALSIKDASLNSNDLVITELNNGEVQFKINANLNITNVQLLDVLGRSIYNLKGNSPKETYNLSKLSNTAYIAKVTLSNGLVISKKAIKQR
ncbi:hypothetical protein [uncultured Winogradskyella sp.]|uniref:hypothetical protein n=1 Tax=uncultured Winogradskyella sp. TaxID=395353 RepID=UPI0026218A4D|nr:hypothetical protein [uncultured Winogradskyella sp.]